MCNLFSFCYWGPTITLLCMGVSIPVLAAPIVTISTSTAGPTLLMIGETATVIVTATVSNPSGPHGGLFTFEQDLLFGNGGSDPQPLQVLSVNRPGVNDDTLTGSDGAILTDRVLDIYGGYSSVDTFGIDAGKILFTVVVKGIAPGQANVLAGPKTTHFGDDIVLWDGSPTVVYSQGPLFNVVVPEPGSLAILTAMFSLLLRRRRQF